MLEPILAADLREMDTQTRAALRFDVELRSAALWAVIGFALAGAARSLERPACAGDCGVNSFAYEFVEIRVVGPGDPDTQILWGPGVGASLNPDVAGLHVGTRTKDTFFDLEAVE